MVDRPMLLAIIAWSRVGSIMPDAAYLRWQAERYFRLARAKSDRKMAANFEALGREFLARAETLPSMPPSWQPVQFRNQPIQSRNDARKEKGPHA